MATDDKKMTGAIAWLRAFPSGHIYAEVIDARIAELEAALRFACRDTWEDGDRAMEHYINLAKEALDGS